MANLDKNVTSGENSSDMNTNQSIDLTKHVTKNETSDAINLSKEDSIESSKYSGLDMNKVHDIEQSFSNQAEDTLNDALNQANKFADNMSNQFKQAFNMNMNGQNMNMNGQNMNMNGQNMNMNGQNMNMNGQNMNMNGQTGNKVNNFLTNLLGNNNQRIMPSGDKSAVVACLLNLLLIGLGSIYLGQTKKGLITLGGALCINFVVGLFTCGIGLAITAPLFVILTMLDSYNCGKQLECGQSIGISEFIIFK